MNPIASASHSLVLYFSNKHFVCCCAEGIVLGLVM